LIPEEDQQTYEVIPLKGTRKAIADNMVRSVQTAAHYTMGANVDCSRLVALRERLKGEFKSQHGIDLTYVPFLVKAIAAAVKDVPIVNATIRDDSILVYKTANVGVAVASEDYIFVPVIKRPILKSLLQVTRELAEFVRLVREKKLAPEHTRGGTITLTNMGVTNATIKAGITIINYPEVAIITQGRIKEQVVPVNGEMCIRPMMDLTFTYDHRVVMGVPGGSFAERVQFYLENPDLLLAC
jgi:pyruvate/2-oxoglutarate dehydrogenase complex dihydrolipoamide acyltransferase (E2) component